MNLTVIGCGMAVPDAERVCSGYHLATHGVALLFDCGPGVVHRMATLGVAWQEITHLCITHFHNDHTGDVAALFFGAVARETMFGENGPNLAFEELNKFGIRGRLRERLTEHKSGHGQQQPRREGWTTHEAGSKAGGIFGQEYCTTEWKEGDQGTGIGRP